MTARITTANTVRNVKNFIRKMHPRSPTLRIQMKRRPKMTESFKNR
jgi:hypothetical protein